jgi:ABC-type sugar transport system, periplasmic component
MKKRLLGLLLTTVMVTSLLAGCTKNESVKETDAPTTEATTNAATDAAVENNGMSELKDNTLSFTVSIPTFGKDTEGLAVQEKWQEMMEEYLGCKLDITWSYVPWADYQQNEEVILASGNLPDVFTYSKRDAINVYGVDGQVLNIAEYEDMLTYYSRFIEGTVGGKDAAYNEDGSAYYFKDGMYNAAGLTGGQSFASFAYRFDVLQEHGLEPATTLEEFDALCAALYELYPDTYVMGNTDKNYAFYRGFTGIFHTSETLYWNGNEWAYGPVEDNFREALKYINSLYEKGYIDPEFATADSDAATEKATTGKFLMSPTLWSGMARHWNVNVRIDDSFEWGLAYLPENPDMGTPWKWGSRLDGSYLVSNGLGIGISANAPNADWLVKLVDYQYSPEMIEMLNWGIEGVTYTKSADGQKQFDADIMALDDPVSELSNYGVMSTSVSRTGIPFVPQDFEAVVQQLKGEPWWTPTDGYVEGQYWEMSAKLGGPDSIHPQDLAPVTFLSPEEAARRADITAACGELAREWSVRFITGELDINSDADWDTYVNTVKYAVDDFDGIIQMLNDNVAR